MSARTLYARFKGFIETAAGPIASVALLIGLFNSLIQVWHQWFQGPEPQHVLPEQVLLVPDPYDSGRVYMRFAMRVSYVNSGPPAHNAIVLRETLSYQFGSERRVQEWQSFENFSGRGCDLESETSFDVGPVSVGGRGSDSHTTYFAPKSMPENEDVYQNFQTVEDFLKDMRSWGEIALELTTKVHGQRDLVSRCRLQLSDSQFKRLEQGCSSMVACTLLSSS